MFRKRLILILMMLTMAVSVVPSLVYAEEVASTASTPVLLRAKAIGTKKVKLSWNKQKDATKYVIYGNKCGLFPCKKLVTTTSNKYTVKKIKSKKLQAHKSYKFYVVAYNGKTKLAKSKTVHFITGNTNKVYGNVKKIVAKKKSLTIKAGQKVKVTAKVKIYKNKKHIKKAHGYGLRFISSNKKIAKVSKTGVVTGVSDGTVTIYIQDITGKYCKTKVTVTGGKKPTPSAEPTPVPPAANPTITYLNSITETVETIEVPANVEISFSAGLHGYYTSDPDPVTMQLNQTLDITTDAYKPNANPDYAYKGYYYDNNTFTAQYNAYPPSVTYLDALTGIEQSIHITEGTQIYFSAGTNGTYLNPPSSVTIGLGQELDITTSEYLPNANTGYAYKGYIYNDNNNTFTAQYTATVTFNLNGHGTITPETQMVDIGGKAVKPTDPTDEGYSFGGWYKEEECQNEWNFTTDTVTEPITLYAKWTEVYTITFRANGGEGEMPVQTINVSQSTALNENAYTCPDEGMTFENQLIGGRIFYVNESANNGGTYTFYNAGEQELTTQTVNGLADAKTYSVTGIKTKFVGWNTKADGTGTSYADKANITLTEDIDLYAQWDYDVDKFYVLATDPNNDNHAVLKAAVQWGAYDTSVGITTDGIGSGKTNTAIALGNSACLSDNNSGDNTIWKWIKERNEEPLNGCNDWFIPSVAELKELQSGGIQKEYIIDTLGNTYQSLWSSVEYFSLSACYVRWSSGDPYNYYKSRDSDSNTVWGCVAVRSF